MTKFDVLYRKFHRQLLLYTLKFVESENDALDIVQNIFVAVWEKRKYEQNEEAFKAYLFGAVKNSCLNYLKHQKIVKKFENETSLHLKEIEAFYYHSGEKSLIEKENLDEITSAIESLSGIYTEVIRLSRIEGLKNQEIAELLNIPVRTVETRIFRALSLLKEKISGKSFLIFLYLNQLGRVK